MNEQLDPSLILFTKKDIVELKQRNFPLPYSRIGYLKVIVIGGLLGGLFTAISLLHINCDEVFEKHL